MVTVKRHRAGPPYWGGEGIVADRHVAALIYMYVAPQTISQNFLVYCVQFFLLLFLVFLFCSNKTY